MSEFMNILKNKFVEKGLSDSTIKNYIRNLEILNNCSPFNNLDFIKNKSKIDGAIKNLKEPTQRSYYCAIVSAVKALNVKYDVTDYYYNKMMDLNKILNERSNSHEKTETQKKNWISMNDIKSKMDELIKTVKSYDPVNVDKKMYTKVLEMVVLSLYVLQPPRRNQDYQIMKICKDKPDDDVKFNYLIFDKQQFIFNKYKTAKSELKNGSELIIDINDNLFDCIKLYLNFYRNVDDMIGNFLLLDYNGKPLINVNSITYILNKIFGLNVGVSMIRHIFLTEKYGNITDEQKNDSRLMSHSVSMQNEYIKK